MSQRRNVVLVVIDTLREDFAEHLEALLQQGFVKYQKVVAPSSWTLPSHVSMFTGQLPSVHQVHEAKGVYLTTSLFPLAKEAMRDSESNLLKRLKSKGYTTHCLTCNLWLTPTSGFEFDDFRAFDEGGEVTDVILTAHPTSKDAKQIASALLRAGHLRTIFKLGYSELRRVVLRLTRAPFLEKGSKYVMQHLDHFQPKEPFFLFINLMEAHEPYFHHQQDLTALHKLILGIQPRSQAWSDAYPRHARLAIEKALAAVDRLKQFDPLIIVTSDHGQLLGERSIYGHGYFLDDELLRVPLYVKYPRGITPFKQTGPLLSLTEVEKLVTAIADAKTVELGTKLAYAESYGSYVDLTTHLEPTVAEEVLDSVFCRRVKLYSTNGEVQFNMTKGLVEEVRGSAGEGEVEIIKASMSPLKGTPEVSPDVSIVEEREIVKKLRDLGYE